MDIQIKYCIHCGTRYDYQASGEGCFYQNVSSEYCEECFFVLRPILLRHKKEIKNALFNIPVKYCFQWVEGDPHLFNDIFIWMQSKGNSCFRMTEDNIDWLYCSTPYINYKVRIGMTENFEPRVQEYKNVEIK